MICWQPGMVLVLVLFFMPQENIQLFNAANGTFSSCSFVDQPGRVISYVGSIVLPIFCSFIHLKF